MTDLLFADLPASLPLPAEKPRLISRLGKIAIIGTIQPQQRASRESPYPLTVDDQSLECFAKRVPSDLAGRGAAKTRSMSAICIGEFSRRDPKKFLADLVVEGRSDARAAELLDIHDFLTDLVDGPAKAFDILDEFGIDTKKIVTENPYKIVEVEGVGFKTADKCAKSLWGDQTFDRYHPMRLQAALALAVADQCLQTGSTIASRVAVINTAMGANYLDLPQLSETRMRLDSMFPALVTAEKIAVHTGRAAPHVGLTRFLHAEKSVAKIVREKLAMGKYGKWKNPPFSAIEAAADAVGITLAQSQEDALNDLLGVPVGVLTGGPGTGKSTILRIFCDVLAKMGRDIALCAPTGRAAQRLGETTGRPASTIHRLFQVGPNGKARVNADAPLGKGMPPRNDEDDDDRTFVDVLVVDEASMLDAGLARVVMNGVNPECQVLFVGDVDQLPAIMPGNVLTDLLATEKVPRARLTEIMRQAEGSDIIRAARQFNTGKGLPRELSGENDFLHVQAASEAEAMAFVRKLLTEVFPGIIKKNGEPIDLTRDVQILATHNDKGEIARWNAAQVFQEIVNPGAVRGKLRAGQNSKTSGFANPDEMVGVDDKVIALKNDYDLGVMNGEIGIVRDIQKDNFGDIESIAVEFDPVAGVEQESTNFEDDGRAPEDGFSGRDDGRAPEDPRRIIVFKGKTLKNVTAAGAITVHKSQGSQFPAVIVLVPRSAGGFVSRRLVYTAMTRAAEFLAVVSIRDSIDLASRELGSPRLTTLGECLASPLNAGEAA